MTAEAPFPVVGYFFTPRAHPVTGDAVLALVTGNHREGLDALHKAGAIH